MKVSGEGGEGVRGDRDARLVQKGRSQRKPSKEGKLEPVTSFGGDVGGEVVPYWIRGEKGLCFGNQDRLGSLGEKKGGLPRPREGRNGGRFPIGDNESFIVIFEPI